MSLDSVELLVHVETQFGIEIPDVEAENISTVGEFAEAVFSKIKTKPSERCISQILFYRLRSGFESFGNQKHLITPETKISHLLPNKELKEEWSYLQSITKLKLPKLVALDLDKNAKSGHSIFGFKFYKQIEPITDADMRILVNWAFSLNWNELSSLEDLSNQYEVERIVSGMLSEHLGIPINEIKLEYSMTNDLGID